MSKMWIDGQKAFKDFMHSAKDRFGDAVVGVLDFFESLKKPAAPKKQNLKVAGAPKFEDATRSKNITPAPEGKPCRTAYPSGKTIIQQNDGSVHTIMPSGKTVISEKDGTTHIILPKDKTADEIAQADAAESDLGAGYKSSNPMPVYHFVEGVKLDDHIKNVFKDEKENVVHTIQIALSSTTALTLKNASEIEAYLETAKSLSAALNKVPVTIAVKENVPEVTEVVVSNMKPLPATSNDQQMIISA